MAAPGDAIIFCIWPNQPSFIPTEKVAVTFKLCPARGTQRCGCYERKVDGSCCRNNPFMLADWGNFLAVNIRCQTAGILPPEIVCLHYHEATVIRVPWIHIGTIGAPEGICQVFTTVDPNPVLFLTLVKLKAHFQIKLR